MLYYIHYLAYAFLQGFIALAVMAVYLAIYWLVLLWPNNGALNFLMFVGALLIMVFVPEILDRWRWGKPDSSSNNRKRGKENVC